MSAEYVPIACAAHERLEFAVLLRRRLRLIWSSQDGQTQFSETVLPLDVATRAGAEWLSIRRQDGVSEVVRLDRIQAVEEA